MNNNTDLTQYLVLQKDPLPGLRALLSYPLCNWVNEYFIYTRDFESGINFVCYCRSVIASNMPRIKPNEHKIWDKYLITLKLNMLDHLNLWQEYMDYYKSVFGKNHCELSTTFQERYEIIKRKNVKQKAGGNIEHLKRHQACTLTEDEALERYNTIIDRLNFLLSR